MKDFKLVSLNVRGLRSINKRKALFMWLTKQKADIVFLQETYSSIEDENFWNTQWNGKMLFSHGSHHSKHRKKFQKNIQVFLLIPIFRKNTLMGKRAISNFSTEITLMCFLNLSVFLAINIKTGKNHGWFYIEIHLWDFRELKTLL